MKNSYKVMVVVGTRPEIIRLSRIINLLDQHTDLILVHTGQNYDFELSKVFFNDLNIRTPDYFLDSADHSNGVAHTIGSVISSVDRILNLENPDAFLVLGDTNSCLSVIPAKRRKIPIFHMEAGNRCFDLRVPEEINRKIVDHVADINLTYSSIAREYLLMEGLAPDTIIKIGSPMYEVLHFNNKKINDSKIIKKLNLEKEKYFLVSFHREENVECDETFKEFINTINCLAKTFNLPIVLSTHPRTRNKINQSNYQTDKRIKILKPLGFFDYINLQINSKVVLSDSGTISEESSILNFPALNIRENHERPEAMEEAAVMFTGVNFERINQCINFLETQERGSKRNLNEVEDYIAPNVSEKILRIILSYTDYVNKKIWKK